MKELLLLLATASISFMLAMGAVTGGVLKKNRHLVMLSALALAVSVGLVGRAGYVFLHKAQSRLANVLRPRTGEEIYEALFAKDASACTQVIESQDQVVDLFLN